MCNAVSFVFTEDQFWFPAPNTWDHSHTAIAKHHGIPDGLIGDKYAKGELTPVDLAAKGWRNADMTLRADVDDWKFTLDTDGGQRQRPAWFSEDRERHVDRARDATRRWLATAPSHLAPGFRAQGGDDATLTGGHYATLTGGDGATLTFSWWDGGRRRWHVAYVGEDGIEPNVAYKLNAAHKPEAVR